MKLKILFPLSVIVLIGFILADPVLTHIQNRYKKFSSLYHIQKVYVHTDKNVYKTGEHIWFKFYLFNDMHRPDTVSKIGYVELIGPDMNIVDVRLLRLKYGMGIGDFLIKDSLPSGLYLIRAYTNLMKNFGEKFFFKKIITIKNPKINYLPENVYLDIKSLNHKRRKLNVKYSLTGNNIISGRENKIYFNVSDYLGNAVKASVNLLENGKIIKSTTTDTLGYGQLNFVAKENKRYKLLLRSGKAKARIILPRPEKYGYQLDLKDQGQFFLTTVKGILPASDDKQFKTIYLLAERNGKIFFTTFGILNRDSISFKLNKNIFPAGIVHFILFNGKGNPVADQIAFTKAITPINLDLNLKKTGKNLYELTVNGDTMLYASVSVSITSTLVRDHNNIADYLTLKADLPQAKTCVLKSPDINEKIKAYSWQRYSPQFIWGKSLDTPKYKVQKSLVVKGKVTKLILDLPVKGTLVKLTVLNSYNDQYKTYTDQHGNFIFTGLNYPDTIMALVEARALNGSKNVLVYIDKYDTIPTLFTPVKQHRKLRLSQQAPVQYQEWKGSSGTLHSNVDQVIYMKDIPLSGNETVFDIMKGRVPGFYQMGDQVFFRGPHSITQNIEPLYLVDNVPVDKSTVESLNIYDIDRIEIIKNQGYTAIYGSRGANGVIAIYTKQGHNIIRGQWQEIQPGYYTPKKFVAQPDSLLITNQFATYFWDAQMIIQKGKGSIKFRLPDGVKAIKVNIQGTGMSGQIINTVKKFDIDK